MTSDENENEIDATRVARTPLPQGGADNPADAAIDATRTASPAPASTPRPPDAAIGGATPSATPSATANVTPGGSAVPAGLQFQPGQMILARYRMKKLLGRGGFGVVWRASDENLHMDVAIKFLAPEIVHNPEAIEDLKQETRYSLRLTHPNIVRIHGFFQDDELAGILMEYVDGGTLQSLKLKRPNRCFEVDELAQWVPAMCAALDYAHAKVKVVHRDLKPANIMLDAAGDVKIADFGISSSISDTHSRLSMGHATSGTPVYMSPQHLIGQRPTVADDVYSFGATLFDLLAGKPPFYTGDIGEQVRRVTAPTIAERRRELGFDGAPIPRVWEEVIASCLAKDPASRPASAGDVAAMLGLVAGRVALRESTSAAAAVDPGDDAFMTRPVRAGDAEFASSASSSSQSAAAHLSVSARESATNAMGSRAGESAASLHGASAATGATSRASAQDATRAQGPNKALIVAGVVVVLAIAAFVVSKMMGGGGARDTVSNEVRDETRVAAGGEEAAQSGAALRDDRASGAPDAGARSASGVATPSERGAETTTGASAAGAAGDARDARDVRGRTDERASASARETDAARSPAPPASAPSSRDAERAASNAASSAASPPAQPATDAAREDVSPPARTAPPPSREKPAAPSASAEDGVRATLAAYEHALETLDARAYASLWRSLAGDERKKVERAFEQFRAQSVNLSIDGIEVSGTTAKARFNERRTLTPNVGSPITQERKVVMSLERAGDGAWRIVEMK